MSIDSRVPPVPDAPAGTGITFRRFRGLDADLPGMAAANQRLRDHIGMIEPITAESMRHAYTHLVNSDPVEDCLVAELDGVIGGYVRVEWHDLVDGDRVYDLTLTLEPAAWGHGAADAMLAWGEARLRAIADAHGGDRRAWFASYAFGHDGEVAKALERRGYVAVRWDAEMLRDDLEDIPDVPAPAGYTIRTPEDAELPAVHDMAIASFAEHWGEWEADEQSYAEWVEDPDFRRDLVVVAFDPDGRPAAYVTNVIERAPDGSPRGLLDGVATHPAHRRRGLARACIAESLRRLRAAGATSAYLGVDTDNHNRALALYESCGFRRVSTATNYRRPFSTEETS